MSEDDYEEKAYEIIAEQLSKKVEDIKEGLEKTLKELGADSLDGIEIATKLEEELDIKIEDNGLTKNTTIREVIAYLQTKHEKVIIR